MEYLSCITVRCLSLLFSHEVSLRYVDCWFIEFVNIEEKLGDSFFIENNFHFQNNDLGFVKTLASQICKYMYYISSHAYIFVTEREKVLSQNYDVWHNLHGDFVCQSVRIFLCVKAWWIDSKTVLYKMSTYLWQWGFF